MHYTSQCRSGSIDGLGFLDLETHLEPEKQLRNVRGRLTIDNADVAGYEIHTGVTRGPALARPAVRLETHPDGALSADEQVLGTYVHGLFDQDAACAALLRWAGLQARHQTNFRGAREASIERLADSVQQHLDTEKLWDLLDAKGPLA